MVPRKQNQHKIRNHFAEHKLHAHNISIYKEFVKNAAVKGTSAGSITAAKIVKQKLCHTQNLANKKKNSNDAYKPRMLKSIPHMICPACFLPEFAKKARHGYSELFSCKSKSDSEER